MGMTLTEASAVLKREIGDMEPGPEREKRFLEVVHKHIEQAETPKEKLIWEALLHATGAGKEVAQRSSN